MKAAAFWATVLALLAGPAFAFDLRIVSLTTSGDLVWTNSSPSAEYNVLRFQDGTWQVITNVNANGSLTLSANVGPLADKLAVFQVDWSNAPIEPILGSWTYEAFDSAKQLVTTGLLTFTASEPLQGTATFTAAGNPHPDHPTGSGDFNNGNLYANNSLEIPLPGWSRNNFRLSGQKRINEISGVWSYTETIVSIPGTGGGGLKRVSGAFLARKIKE